MGKYIGIRLAHALVILAIVVVLVFVIARIIPGDAIMAAMAGSVDPHDPSVVERVRHQYGLDQLMGAFFIEVVFAIPGLGRMSVDAIFEKDYPVMQAMLSVVSLNVLLVNLLVDILYGYLDPRVRVRG